MGANVRLENNLGLASLKAAMHVMLLMITRRVSTHLPFNTIKLAGAQAVSSGVTRAFFASAVKGLFGDVKLTCAI
jgi:hypothetical protein